MSTMTLRGERVVLRDWTDADLAPFAALNADPEVMRYLTTRLSREDSDAYAKRIRDQLEKRGFGMWALDVPAPDAAGPAGQVAFAGFVGLSASVPFEFPLAGIVAAPHEIGWRLARWAWGHGYASEAAALALRHGFDALGLPQVVSFTATANVASQAVMRRIGLTRRGEFDHPNCRAGHLLRRHVLYAQDASPSGSPGS